MTWQSQALCARPQFKNLPGWDPDEMTETYTKEGRRYQLRRVQLVCAACPVQAECHQAAQDWHVTAGVWAGQRYFDATRRLRASTGIGRSTSSHAINAARPSTVTSGGPNGVTART